MVRISRGAGRDRADRKKTHPAPPRPIAKPTIKLMGLLSATSILTGAKNFVDGRGKRSVEKRNVPMSNVVGDDLLEVLNDVVGQNDAECARIN
ncbi:hypothetical protein TorRG33x02_285090 [Trema orientale]|uniref:Uncharacterized protein n=1 Tax=Trema orientale TaxID=63057 RepID=A0A2P5CGW6_TREOI|nr:hypothetical protein TorRG33x02_285090 [Trema orientale]